MILGGGTPAGGHHGGKEPASCPAAATPPPLVPDSRARAMEWWGRGGSGLSHSERESAAIPRRVDGTVSAGTHLNKRACQAIRGEGSDPGPRICPRDHRLRHYKQRADSEGQELRYEDRLRLAQTLDEDDEISAEARGKRQTASALMDQRSDWDHGRRIADAAAESREA